MSGVKAQLGVVLIAYEWYGERETVCCRIELVAAYGCVAFESESCVWCQRKAVAIWLATIAKKA